MSASKIIEKAKSMLGTIGYNVLWNNCEHFAAFCRYGKMWSEQVNLFSILSLETFRVIYLCGYEGFELHNYLPVKTKSYEMGVACMASLSFY